MPQARFLTDEEFAEYQRSKILPSAPAPSTTPRTPRFLSDQQFESYKLQTPPRPTKPLPTAVSPYEGIRLGPLTPGKMIGAAARVLEAIETPARVVTEAIEASPRTEVQWGPTHPMYVPEAVLGEAVRKTGKVATSLLAEPKNWPFLLAGGAGPSLVRPAVRIAADALVFAIQELGAIESLISAGKALKKGKFDWESAEAAAMQQGFAMLALAGLARPIKARILREADLKLYKKAQERKRPYEPPPPTLPAVPKPKEPGVLVGVPKDPFEIALSRARGELGRAKDEALAAKEAELKIIDRRAAQQITEKPVTAPPIIPPTIPSPIILPKSTARLAVELKAPIKPKPPKAAIPKPEAEKVQPKPETVPQIPEITEEANRQIAIFKENFDPKVRSLVVWLRDRGGVKDPGGDLQSRQPDKNLKAFQKKLIKQDTGMDLDLAREAAVEAGYIARESTLNDFLDVIDRELRGSPTYRAADVGSHGLSGTPLEGLGYTPSVINKALKQGKGLVYRKIQKAFSESVEREQPELKEMQVAPPLPVLDLTGKPIPPQLKDIWAGVPPLQIKAGAGQPLLGLTEAEAKTIAARGRRPELLKEGKILDETRIVESELFEGRGGQQRTLAEAEAATGENLIFNAMKAIEPQSARGALVYIPQLRESLKERFPDKASFDKAVMQLAEEGKIQLQRHDLPAVLSAAEKNAMIAADMSHPSFKGMPQQYFNTIGKRMEGLPETKPLTEILLTKLDEAEVKSREKIKQSFKSMAKGETLGAGLPVELMVELVKFGGIKAAKGIVQFSEWSAEMVSEFGEQIRPHLQEIYSKAMERAANLRKFNPDDYFKFTRANVSPAEMNSLRAAVIESVIETGRIPKEKITFEEIRQSAKDMFGSDLLPYLKGFEEKQAEFLAVFHAARQRINTLGKEVMDLRKRVIEERNIDPEKALDLQKELIAKDRDREQYLDVFMRIRSGTGRNLGIQRMESDSTWNLPYQIQKASENMGLPPDLQIPSALREKLADIIEAWNAATTKQGKREAEIKLAKTQADLKLASPWEVARAFWKAMKFGVFTSMRNISGTAGFQVMEAIAKIPASLSDMTLELAFGKSRQVRGLSPEALGRSMQYAATKGVKAAGEVMRSGLRFDELGKMEVPRELPYKMKIGQKTVDIERLAKVINFQFRTLAAQDRIFDSYAFRYALEEGIWLEAHNKGIPMPSRAQIEKGLEQLKEGAEGPLFAQATPDAYLPSQTVLANALAYGKYATFNKDHILASELIRARRRLETKGTPGQAAALATDIVVPFPRTPANIYTIELEYTAGAPVYAAGPIFRKIVKKLRPQDRRTFEMAIGRGMTGAAMLYLGWKLGESNIITPPYERQEGARATQEAAERQPGSIKIDIAGVARWVGLASLAPWGSLIVTGAMLHSEATRPLLREELRPWKVLAGVTRTSLEMPMVSGLKDVAETIGEPESRLPRYAGRVVSGWIPTYISEISMMLDPWMRDSRSPTLTGTIGGSIAMRSPFRFLLPKRLDILGRERQQTVFGAPVLELSDPIRRELAKHRISIGWSRRQVDKKTGESESDIDYRLRTQFIGKLIETQVGRTIKRHKYQSGDQDTQAAMLKEAIDQARDKAESLLKARKGSKRTLYLEKKIESLSIP